MRYEDVVKAWWNAQLDPLGEGQVWSELNDRERIEFALSLVGKVEKQEPVAGTDKYGEDFCHKSTNYFNVPLYSAPQPCPKCEERKTTALNYISLTFEFEQLQSKCEKLKAERDSLLRAVDTDYEQLYRETLAERDELAAQVEKMRTALEESQRWHQGDKWRGNYDTALRAAWDEHMNTLVSALALPDLSTSILNKVRAEALSNAAIWFRTMRPFEDGSFDVQPGGHSEIAAVLIDRLAKQAADMGAGK